MTPGDPVDDRFDHRARAAHAAALAALSPRVRAQLARRRRDALLGRPPAPASTPLRAPAWLVAGALALAAAVVAVGLPPADHGTPPAPSTPSALAAAPAASVAAPLEEDPALYLWLASSDAIALASE
jgi:hypothetical protein